MRDDCFVAYLNDNDFLKHVLPISEGVNDILKDIFVMNPARRLSLANLRSKVLALDTFMILENDLAIEQGPNQFDAGISSVSEPCDFRTPVHGQSDPSLVSDAAFKSALTVPFSDSSGSSGPESKGPITPTTHAVDVDPPVDIPDISSAVLGDVQKTSVVCEPQEVVSKARRPADILRAVVQRFNQRFKSLSKPVLAP
jgi:hypothetical protein